MVIVRAIEHTGIDLAGWLRPANPRSGPAPTPAPEGSLKGHKVALLGAPRDSLLAHRLAGQGARVVASVGTTTTMLVISKDQPYGRFVHASPAYRKAEELRQLGSKLKIVAEHELFVSGIA